MMSLSAIKSAGGAGHYFDHDDYYSESGDAPSEWIGSGAGALNLRGAVGRDELVKMLGGELPSGDRLGTERGGEWQHRPGYDATFSAPKSVSVLALAGGDQRLIAAHREAVADAVQWLEAEAITSRVRKDGDVYSERTGNVAVAAFHHATSREQDPQLHTHALIINATRRGDGEWRSIDGRELYRVQMSAGARYRAVLASKVRDLGYQIVRENDGTFQIAGVPESVRREFSQRSEQIESALAERGQTRDSASAREKETATLDTRRGKERYDRGALANAWRERVNSAGYDAAAAIQASIETASAPEFAEQRRVEREAGAAEALEAAAEILTERQSVAGEKALLARAEIEGAAAGASPDDIKGALRKAIMAGEILVRKDPSGGDELGYTTREVLRTERAVIAIEKAGRDQAEALLDERAARAALARAEAGREHSWTKGQREAALGLLTGTNRIAGIQGYAGTAKTTSVLRAFAAQARLQGFTVKGMAPTKSAADSLRDGGEIENCVTLAAHLGHLKRERTNDADNNSPEDKPARREMWIVDEASLAGARDTRDLLRGAEQVGARVLLVGDVKQLGSVEAGEAFRQLQEHGMETHVLDEIVRQRDASTRKAVEHSIEGDAEKAMAAVERSGTVHEIADASERRARMAEDYLALSPEQREETIMIDPTRRGRSEVNDLVRGGLKMEGTLTGPDVAADRWEKKDLTRRESKSAHSYKANDVVRFARSYEKHGVEKDGYYQVTSVGEHDGRAVVILQGKVGNEIVWDPAKWGGGDKSEVFQKEESALSAGDQIIWTRNDRARGLNNGTALTIESVDDGQAVAVTERGQKHALELVCDSDKHWRHSYAQTAHAVQGRTCDRVMSNVDSRDALLVNQRSFYVALSRARESAHVYTDDRKKLAEAIRERTGIEATALESEHPDYPTPTDVGREAGDGERERAGDQQARIDGKPGAEHGKEIERRAQRWSGKSPDRDGWESLGAHPRAPHQRDRDRSYGR